MSKIWWRQRRKFCSQPSLLHSTWPVAKRKKSARLCGGIGHGFFDETKPISTWPKKKQANDDSQKNKPTGPENEPAEHVPFFDAV